MKIKSINFILENCEVIEISGEDIGVIQINDIKENMSGFRDGDIEKYKTCSEFAIEIFQAADCEYELYGVKSEWSKFERLSKLNDITAVQIKYDNEETEKLYVKYDDTNDNFPINTYQKNYISKCDNLYIVIDENLSIDDYFSKAYIDSQSYTLNK